MRQQHDLCAVLLQVLYGGQGGPNAGVIRNLAVVIARDIEIHAHKGGFSI
jgi:hypothetical protein